VFKILDPVCNQGLDLPGWRLIDRETTNFSEQCQKYPR